MLMWEQRAQKLKLTQVQSLHKQRLKTRVILASFPDLSPQPSEPSSVGRVGDDNDTLQQLVRQA